MLERLITQFPQAHVGRDARYRAVTLDVAGVLVLPDHELILPGADQRAAWDAVFYSVKIRHDSTYDDLDWNALADAVGAPLAQVRDYVSRLHELHASPLVWRAAPGAEFFLRQLRLADVPSAAISNTLRPMAKEVLERAGLIGPMGLEAGLVFDSSIVGIAKPDARLFQLTFDKLGVNPEQVIHIGDSLRDDIEGAAGAGASGIHMQPFGSCEISDHRDISEFTEIDIVVGENR